MKKKFNKMALKNIFLKVLKKNMRVTIFFFFLKVVFFPNKIMKNPSP